MILFLVQQRLPCRASTGDHYGHDTGRRARELARLFEAWRRAFDAQDHAAMQSATRAIDAFAAGDAPREEKFIG